MTSAHSPALSAMCRVVWMMIGPLALVLLIAAIVNIGNGWFTAADIGFLIVLGIVVLARWLEFRGGSPQTATGEPATPDHLRRFAIGAVVLGLGLWVIANVIANHWLA